jgi:hypothetical protein
MLVFSWTHMVAVSVVALCKRVGEMMLDGVVVIDSVPFFYHAINGSNGVDILTVHDKKNQLVDLGKLVHILSISFRKPCHRSLENKTFLGHKLSLIISCIDRWLLTI